MADDLNGGGGRGAAAYLYSWLSAHAMQRATTVAGSPRDEFFLTEKMKHELTEAKKHQRAAVEANKRVHAAGKTAAIKEEKDERKAKKKQPMAEEAAASGDRKERGVLDQEAAAVKPSKTNAALKLVQEVIAERKEAAKKKDPTMAKEEAAAGGVLDLLEEIIERRLGCWEKLKHDTRLVFPESSAGGGVIGVLDTEAFRKESIEEINQAMYKEVYLAAVHAIKQKRGNTTLPTPPTPN